VPATLAERRPYVLFAGRFEDARLPVLPGIRTLEARRPGLTLVVAGDGRRWRYEGEGRATSRVSTSRGVPGATARLLPARRLLRAQHRQRVAGIVLLEAMAAGCPSSPADRGLRRVAWDGVDGLLVPRATAALATRDRALEDSADTPHGAPPGEEWPRIAGACSPTTAISR
jgi:glycosyltransferase involved in cell wall biosynthesis